MDSVLGWLNTALSVVIGLILLVILVVAHELGHAIAARRNGVVVEEFGIGFPPRAWGRKIKKSILGKQVLFSLNWLPLGGFVKLQGEHDAAVKKGDYGAANLWQKTKILMAGVTMNWLLAALIFTILALFGLPKVLPNQFGVAADQHVTLKPVVASYVVDNSPADKAGIKAGDKLLNIDGQAIKEPAQLNKFTKQHAGQTVDVKFKTDSGLTLQRNVSLNAKNTGDGYLGLAADQQSSIRSTWSAPIVGVGTTIQFSVLTFTELGKLVVHLGQGLVSKLSLNPEVREEGQAELSAAGSGVAGPVGILGTIFPAAREAGIMALLYLTGIISLTLAVMNVLPIPALDGGRLFVTLLYRARKKPLTKEKEEKIQAVGFYVLMGLVVLVTVVDVGRFFK